MQLLRMLQLQKNRVTNMASSDSDDDILVSSLFLVSSIVIIITIGALSL